MVTISAGPILLPDAGFQWLDDSCLVSGETFKPSIVIRLSIWHLRKADLLFFSWKNRTCHLCAFTQYVCSTAFIMFLREAHKLERLKNTV